MCSVYYFAVNTIVIGNEILHVQCTTLEAVVIVLRTNWQV
jgi:hypothetical protein